MNLVSIQNGGNASSIEGLKGLLMRGILVSLFLILALLYGARYLLLQGHLSGEEWTFKLREGAESLQERLQSPEFREKVLSSLQESQLAFRDEVSQQWDTLRELARQGMVRLDKEDAQTTKEFAHAVIDQARAEGMNITFDEAKLKVPPPHWMIAAVTNLILLAWLSLAIFALWAVARFLGGRRER